MQSIDVHIHDKTRYIRTDGSFFAECVIWDKEAALDIANWLTFDEWKKIKKSVKKGEKSKAKKVESSGKATAVFFLSQVGGKRKKPKKADRIYNCDIDEAEAAEMDQYVFNSVC